MKYWDFLNEIEQDGGWSNILVTGPQRSGTTLVAHALARDLALSYCDEDDIGWEEGGQNKEVVLRRTLACATGGYVFQGPACAHICHTLPEDTVVVFMRRDVQDIEKSQKRIEWAYEQIEMDKYPPEYHQGSIAETKYHYWESVQQDQIRYSYEIEYESLREHPLWVEDKQEFTARQWRLDGLGTV